jgi:hypothetical protein
VVWCLCTYQDGDPSEHVERDELRGPPHRPSDASDWGMSSGGGVIAARLARDSGKEQRFRRDGSVARGGASEAELSRRGSGRRSGG